MQHIVNDEIFLNDYFILLAALLLSQLSSWSQYAHLREWFEKKWSYNQERRTIMTFLIF